MLNNIFDCDDVGTMSSRLYFTEWNCGSLIISLSEIVVLISLSEIVVLIIIDLFWYLILCIVYYLQQIYSHFVILVYLSVSDHRSILVQLLFIDCVILIWLSEIVVLNSLSESVVLISLSEIVVLISLNEIEKVPFSNI
jgi:hypothetical protein